MKLTLSQELASINIETNLHLAWALAAKHANNAAISLSDVIALCALLTQFELEKEKIDALRELRCC